MNRYRGRDGKERLWFADREIEGIALGALDAAGLTPDDAHPRVEIEGLLEGFLSVRLDQYASLPAGILGVTEFPAGDRPLVRINGELTQRACDLESPTVSDVGRWRATLAHEAGHVLLHRILFEPDPSQASLFEAGSDGPEAVQCLERNVHFAATGYDWREVQANRCMAALLMPEALFRRVASRGAAVMGSSLPVVAGSEPGIALTGELAAAFAVSRQAAGIRLETCGLASPAVPSFALD